ncbi:CMP-N-acetylneuraminate-poly-alpha-2,8-sialyltransferase-like [Lytechinus variegatus]|uniref:CMP-N-acetylneuraminate-poly-alpha-2, 8-sialyltransferase-like n=1 Tax=Lytechinus variegatus TaxID=7654 RepID=UPI001BB0DDD2|nr:CMP-N-acetylneuraminate-poly-alpha-2,8-sialyltransferase-like [Lytechinus variegatus]
MTMIFVRSIDVKAITFLGVTVSLMIYIVILNYGSSVLFSYHIDAMPYKRASIFVKSTLNSTVVQALRKTVGTQMHQRKPIKIFYGNNKTAISEIPERVESCALVGNSGILLNSGCGHLIDESDLVIRMNLAEFGHEYSPDVGSKVSFMTINGEQCRLLKACFTNKKKENESASEWLTRIPAECGTTINRLKLLKNDSVLWTSRGHADKITPLLPHLRERFHLFFSHGINYKSLISPAIRLWHFRAPSSGLTLLAPMFQLCDEVSLFGFYPFHTDPYNRTILHHYYEPEVYVNYTTNAHKMPEEYQFLLDLENKGAIRIINNCTPSN